MASINNHLNLRTTTYSFLRNNCNTGLWQEQYLKSYGIAIGILLLSFLFPIIKLLYILFLILCTKYVPKSLSPHSIFHRHALFILELLNKYSFINIFLLVISMSCIYVNINNTMDLNSVNKYYSTKVTSVNVISTINIEPVAGIVIFGIAMIIPCVITVIIKYKYISFYDQLSPQFYVQSFDVIHQNKLFKTTYDERHPQSVTTSPRSLYYSSSFNESKSPLLFSKNYAFRTVCLKMASFIFFIFVVMCAVTLFIAQISSIEIEYIGEIAPYMTNPSSKRIYSLDGIVQSVDIENNDGHTKCLRIIYELFGIVFPLIPILLLTMLWLIPIPKWIHIRLKGTIWWTHMLNAMDVIIVSCILIVYELPQTFKYIVQHQYSDMSDIEEVLHSFYSKYIDVRLVQYLRFVYATILFLYPCVVDFFV